MFDYNDIDDDSSSRDNDKTNADSYKKASLS